MLQFSNEPLALTHIHLSYLSLEERIGFMMLLEQDLLKEGPWKLTPQDIPKFRQTIQLSLEKDYQQLIDNNVRITYQPGDKAPLTLARTLQEQQREIAALLKSVTIAEARKAELRAFLPEGGIKLDTLEDMIKLDALLNDINMELAEPRLPEIKEGVSEISLNSLGLTRLPEALVVRLQEYPQLTRLKIANNNLTTLPESFGNLTALTRLNLSLNNLTTLPDSFGNLTALTRLNLSRNNLTTLPDSFGNLTALTRLNLSRNNLTILPESLRETLIRTKNTDLLPLLAPEQLKHERKPMLLAPCPSSRRRVEKSKSKVFTPLKEKTEKRKGDPAESSWLALQAMVKEVEKLSDKASIDGLRVVRDFLNNPGNVNDDDGLRALLTDDASGEQMGIGVSVKQFKEAPVSKLYDNLFKALQDGPKRKLRKIT